MKASQLALIGVLVAASAPVMGQVAPPAEPADKAEAVESIVVQERLIDSGARSLWALANPAE